MKREILIPIVFSCVLALTPMLASGQSNNTTGSKLKIAIPAREFNDFVTIQRNLNTGQNNYSGFAIEVFKQVMNISLPLTLFDFVPFQKSDGTMNGTFDDMLKAVASKDYDGAVGEITIQFYRTEWVDFTMPYMDSSITMLVHIKPQQATNVAGSSLIKIAEAFVITIYVFSIIIAAIYFVGMTKWAKLVGGSDIRPRDKTLGSLTHTRLLITTFFLILMIPIACYIISQASSYASQRRSGNISTLNELIRKNANVGYREGSFIRNLLIQRGFSESKLISLKSEEEMVDKLSKGSSEGGVDAIVGDAPSLKLLQAKYCDTFTMVPTTNLLATGFGFAFGKNSSLTKDVSDGILKIVDDGRLGKIQETTIGKLETCDDSKDNIDVGSAFLSPDYKWILIVGAILVGLFILFSIVSLY